ncbi:hypothetical protein [Haloarchaeobius sp. FL176]|uniref:DUF7331 family protein n=1 Tax=Haloarchaeobius sp. FL176 TaxID=2967129 RepID=UPI002148E40A|nr:hypothetical protein [Haloarchaeobius sp. FL176]
MSTNNEKMARIDPDPKPKAPDETVVDVTLEDGLVIYDSENPDAWITSTTGLDTSDVC